MYRIAQNLWFDQGRAAKVRGEPADLDSIAELTGSDGRSVTESRLTLAAVFNAMSRLPPEQQVLVTLVCVDGLSYKEAAETLDMPIGTVMSRLARARQAIAAGLNERPDGNVVVLEERRGGKNS
jgi:RNA polymerase sigma-70 factor (ECF subfamily)